MSDLRVYTLSDFNALPSVPLPTGIDATRAAPEMPSPLDVRLIHDKVTNTELLGLLTHRKQDRSAALWRAYNLCYRLRLSEEECYALLANSPNDKFHAEWRYNADDGLWKDICRGYHMAHTPEDRGLPGVIDDILLLKISSREKYRRIANVLRIRLLDHGAFYHDPVRYETFYVTDNRAIPMDGTHPLWQQVLFDVADLIPTSREFAPVNDLLRLTVSASKECHVTPHTFAWWNTAKRWLYVSNGHGGVYRLDGERIELVSNGTDGVLFRQDDEAEPFDAIPPAADALVPTLESAVLSLPNYKDSVTLHTRAEAMLLSRVWLYALFFGERFEARPPLVFIGETSSGKTIAMKAVGELLKGPAFDVRSLPNDKKEYEGAVSNAAFVFFDNVDESSGRRWLPDSLAETATGMRITRRQLYTTNTMISFRVACFVGITTRNPFFSRIDVANRMIPVHVERRDDNLDPAELFAPIREHRGTLWWELLSDLNKIIAVLHTFEATPHKMRMAGYADFTMAVCQALGIDPTRILTVLEGSQSNSTLDNSVIWQLLQPWLKKEDRDTGKKINDGQWIAAGRLWQELKPIARIEGTLVEYERVTKNKIVFSRQLGELIPDLKKVIDVDVIKSNQGNRYWFHLREDSLALDEEEAAA
jgi:hypothetical protein